MSEEIKKENEALKAQLAELSAKANGAEAAYKKAADRIAQGVRHAELAGVAHPDILSLAPQVELDADLQPTKSSLEALRAWRTERPSLFAQPENKQEAPKDPAAPAAPAAPKAPAYPSYTPAPTVEAPKKISLDLIAKTFRDDPKTYRSPEFQKQMIDFFARESK